MENNWIPISERLPIISNGQYGINILIAIFDSVYEEIHPGSGYTVSGCLFDIDGKFKGIYFDVKTKSFKLLETTDNITHWMYKPDPPKI